MNEKEICFILCTNNEMFAEECMYYIRHLIVPEDYSIDVLTVEDAKSMTAGYNEAMQYSKAKYKVYLHQDVFIVNPYFIRDMLAVFQMDRQIGMLGMVGALKIPQSGIMWKSERVAMLYEQRVYETVLLNRQKQPAKNDAYWEVEAIDGLLMATQYDLPWREDLFTGWDFYDASQSMEFIRHGYKVVVPKMEEPWCIHDSGFCNMWHYEEERRKYVREYLENQNV